MKKKLSKIKQIKRLKKELDKLWSTIIRKRDKVCLVCGGTKNLQAHHCIIRKARSLWTRWTLSNGIVLCYFCHLCQLHRYSDKLFLNEYMDKLNAKIPQDMQDEIVILSKIEEPPTLEDLETQKKAFEIILADS